MWNADQLHVRELDARAGFLVTVIQQHFEAGSGKLRVQLVGGFANLLGFVAQRHQGNLERREGVAPDDPVFVVVLLDGSRHHAGHADTVATHFQGDRLAVLAQHFALHRLAVLVAQLEDVPDFDAALDFQGALAVGARVAGDHVTQVGHGRYWQVALPVHAEVVLVVDVGTDAEVAHQLDGTVDDDWQWQVQRAE
ncbi:hypothetical protein D3C73_961610 [compost metagenome]